MDERKRRYLARLAAQIESQARAPGRNSFSEAPVMPHSLSLRLPAVGGLCQPVNVCTYEVSLPKRNNKGIHKTQLKQRTSTEKQNKKNGKTYRCYIRVFFFKFVHLGWQSKIIEIVVVFFFIYLFIYCDDRLHVVRPLFEKYTLARCLTPQGHVFYPLSFAAAKLTFYVVSVRREHL